MKKPKHDKLVLTATAAVKKRFWSHVRVGTGCWVFGLGSKTKYARFYIEGVCINAHRVAKLWESPPGKETLLACHKCHYRGCVRPSHIYWGTIAQNNADRIKDGTSRPDSHLGEKHPGAKLTAKQARQICKEYDSGGISASVLARRFGVTSACIARVVKRQTWVAATSKILRPQMERTQMGHVKGERHHQAILAARDVHLIRKALFDGEPQRSIAARFRVSQGAVADIKHKRTWTHL